LLFGGEVSGSRMQAIETVDVYMGVRSWVGLVWVGVVVLGVGDGSEGGGEGFLRCCLGMRFFVMRGRVFV
jgi:hypothetical protein